jgi:hypothetical protein
MRRLTRIERRRITNLAREPQKRVSHEALLVQADRYRGAAGTSPFGIYFGNGSDHL